MSKTHPDRAEIESVLEFVAREAADYLRTVDDQPVLSAGAEQAASRFNEPFPDRGAGASDTLRRLLDDGRGAMAATTGPKCFHFVMGGTTPASMGADMLATVFDQLAYTWLTSPLAIRLEQVCLRWLRDLFGLPADGGGVFTTGATMANFVGLAAARQWWGEKQGVDISERGLAGLPPIPLFSSGHLHPASVKAMGMLGIGRSSARRLTLDGTGRLDSNALEEELRSLDGAPAIIVANAGEVNAGEFDPIEIMADLAERYGAWLHVDGAFGLFAAVSPRTAHLVRGVERADSVTVDGHKWLNVPYDTGFSFVADSSYLSRIFTYASDYLPDPNDPRPTISSPEGSRRARSLAVWATLNAYGREGHRAMIERHLDLAQRMATRVDEAGDLERLAEVPLNIVCFRYNPGGLAESALTRLNRELSADLLEDGRFYAGPTVYDGKAALRPAIVNWRTRDEDIDAFVETVRELGAARVRSLSQELSS